MKNLQFCEMKGSIYLSPGDSKIFGRQNLKNMIWHTYHVFLIHSIILLCYEGKQSPSVKADWRLISCPPCWT